MNGRMMVWALVAAGIGLAILIGLLGGCNENGGGEQARAESDLCSSLSGLRTSISDVESLDPVSGTRDDYDSAVSGVQDDWEEVESDASELREVNVDTLQSAWDDFEQAVDEVDDDASVDDALADISQAAETFAGETESTFRLNCS